ncbi:MAG: hypothetical protein EOO10_08060 [Chitinophagaceae bacterium]|nr:MAG: hypothetical protein EOO10_08060 [Chitinophagaceae bacterium]
MKMFFGVVVLVGLTACENATSVNIDLDSTKNKIDTFVNRVENSEVVDSIKSKGGVILDSVKSKGGKLIDKVDIKIGEKKDTTK